MRQSHKQKAYEITYIQNQQYHTVTVQANAKYDAIVVFSKEYKTDPIKIIEQKSKNNLSFNTVSSSTQLEIFHELNTLLQSNIVIYDAVSIVLLHAYSKSTKILLTSWLKSLHKGDTFYQSILKSPIKIDNGALAILGIYEQNGRLKDGVAQLTSLLKRKTILQTKIKKALSYPTFAIFALFASFIFITYFIMPNFQILFSSFKDNIPLPTQILIFIAKNINYIFISSGVIVLLGIVLVLMYLLHTTFRLFAQKLFLALPFVGKSIRYYNYALIFLFLSQYSKSNTNTALAIKQISNITKNMVFVSELNQIYTSLQKGSKFSQALANSTLFEPYIQKIISTLEYTNKTNEAFLYLGAYYDEKLERYSEKLIGMIEPSIIMFISLIVLVFALGLFLPIWQLGTVL